MTRSFAAGSGGILVARFTKSTNKSAASVVTFILGPGLCAGGNGLPFHSAHTAGAGK